MTLVALLLALMTALLLAACGGEDTPKVELTELANWQSYTIMRPDIADESTIQSAVKLTQSIEEKLGTKLTLTTDWVKRGQEAPTGTLEILVGSTNRPESTNDLLYYDYRIEFINNRVAISGGSGEAVAAGVDWFIENCLGTTMSVPAEPMNYAGEYPLKDVTIEGTLLSDYAVKVDLANFPDEYRALRTWIAENTGKVPAQEGDKLIKLAVSDDLMMNQMSMAHKDGSIFLEVGTYGVEIGKITEQFISTVENRSGDAVTLAGVMELSMDQISMLSQSQMDTWRKQTDDRIDEILTSPNMEIPAGKVVYYVSNNGDDMNDGKTPETAWKTLEKVNGAALASGNYVCFERGGLWRGQLKTKPGVTYTAYGKGDKPTFYASPFDGADPAHWSKTDVENIWVLDTAWSTDLGTIVFNHGEEHAIKCVIRTEASGETFNNTTGEPFKTYADLTTDLHFYHDYSKTGKVYLLSTEGNPGERFDSIEFSIKQHVVSVGSNSNVTIDNLCIKYGGAHGVSAGTVSNLTVQNCEFGWIGGSIQAEGIFNRNYGTRYGNAVEIYGGCNNFTVTDNYIYQVYDAAITQQVGLDSSTTNIKHQKNMYYARNVIEYCNYSIEYFLSSCPVENPSRMENFVIEDNLMWYAAEGLCQQRPDGNQGAHIKGWTGTGRNRATGFVVKNNLMFDSNDMLVQIMSDLYNPDGSDSMPTFSGNNFVGVAGGQFGTVAMEDSSRASYGMNIVGYIGEKSDGTDTYWFMKPEKNEETK